MISANHSPIPPSSQEGELVLKVQVLFGELGSIGQLGPTDRAILSTPTYCGLEKLVSRVAHNHKNGSSSLSPATTGDACIRHDKGAIPFISTKRGESQGSPLVFFYVTGL